MRVIVILFLGITVVALVLKYFPGAGPDLAVASERADPAPTARTEPEVEEPAFIQPPARPAATGRQARSGGPPRAAAAPQERTEGGHRLEASVELRDTPDLAGALLHRRPEAFQAYLDEYHADLNPRRSRLLLSFSLAAAGMAERAVTTAKDLAPGEGVSEAEFSLLQEAVSGRVSAARSASAGRSGSARRAMELALLAREGKERLDARDWGPAARALSRVILEDLTSPWSSDAGFTATWVERLTLAQGSHRWSPTGSWRSVEIEVGPGDNLTLVRKRAIEEVPGLFVCTGLIGRVNRLGERYLQAGEELRVPTDPVSTLVDLDARHLLLLFGDEVAAAWPVTIGAQGQDTPVGEYVVGELIEEPSWFRRGQPMVPYGDPKNELGTRWIGWKRPDGTATNYGFHGTWEPERIGEAASDGCVRLRNLDVEDLFEILPRGTAILVQP